jgi:hypothetical protein
MKLVMPDTSPPLIKRWEAVREGQDFRNSRGFPFLDNGKKGITQRGDVGSKTT